MRLSWFFIASIAVHAALALIRYSPATVYDQEIAAVQLYFETDETTTPEPPVLSGATKNERRQIKQKTKTRLLNQQAITAAQAYSNSLPQITEQARHSFTSFARETDQVAIVAQPAEEVSLAAGGTTVGVEATGVPFSKTISGAEEAGDAADSASETFSRAEYAYHPKPNYPERARREGWEGTVVLEVSIDSQGRPERIAINRSSGFAILDHAAREAVKGWRFRPASLGKRQITSTERVPIVFRLDTKN
jgi:TonB family protein